MKILYQGILYQGIFHITVTYAATLGSNPNTINFLVARLLSPTRVPVWFRSLPSAFTDLTALQRGSECDLPALAFRQNAFQWAPSLDRLRCVSIPI